MKHVTYGEKAHFLGDDVADVLMQYASALSNSARSDTVTITAVDDHGNTVEATFLLTPSTVMVMESSSSDMTEPENSNVIEYMRTQTTQLLTPPAIQPEARPSALEDDHGQPGLG